MSTEASATSEGRGGDTGWRVLDESLMDPIPPGSARVSHMPRDRR